MAILERKSESRLLKWGLGPHWQLYLGSRSTFVFLMQVRLQYRQGATSRFQLDALSQHLQSPCLIRQMLKEPAAAAVVVKVLIAAVHLVEVSHILEGVSRVAVVVGMAGQEEGVA